MSFSRYPSYKESGVEWLGQVPEHWEVGRVKNYFSTCSGGTPNTAQQERYYTDENGTPWIRTTDLTNDVVNSVEIFITNQALAETACAVLPPGTVVIAMYGGDGTVGKNGLLGIPAAINQALCGLLPSLTHCPEYTFRFMQFYRPFWMIGAESSRKDPNISQERVRNEFFFKPPMAEQVAVAAFLDRETGKIDELVAEQRRLMALLKEKRQAVISHAVTRGLNPAAPLKPSGIEWLGDVPAHWETRMVAKASTKITNGFVGPTRDILVEAGVPYIQATHIKGGRVNFDDAYFVKSEWSKAHAKSILAEGDVLIVQTGAGTGDVGLVSKNEVGFNCHALIIVAPDTSILRGPFLSAVLQSTYGQQKLASIQTGAMHPHLNCGEVKFVEIPLPPLNEQADIVEYIVETAARFDSLTAEAQRAIDLLQERRTSLISAAVTGQIDVREEVIA